jgi:hypothetical protein
LGQRLGFGRGENLNHKKLTVFTVRVVGEGVGERSFERATVRFDFKVNPGTAKGDN